MGSATLYFTRPQPNPDPTGPDDQYLWLGSTDHASGTDSRWYTGYSAAPDIAPASWRVFSIPGNQPETPCFVYNPGDVRPYWAYYHPNDSDSGGLQNSRLRSAVDAEWDAGTDEGEVLPATANITTGLLEHTGSAYVERRSATNWHCWSHTRPLGPHDRSEYGHWTSTDGKAWTCTNDDIDARSMVAAGRQLNLRSLSRFQVDGVTCGVCIEHPESAGGSGANPGGRIACFKMPTETTFTDVVRLWAPADDGLTDNLRSLTSIVDPEDDHVVHLYIHIGKTTVHHATLTFP